MTPLAGTGRLVRLALRRDRVLLPVWILGLVVLAVTSAAATGGLFADTESLVRAAESMNASPAMVAVYGRVHDTASLGAVAMLKALGSGAALVAVFAITLVVRHSRGDEESGRGELVGSTVVGRLAPLTAALAVAGGAVVVLGLVTALGVAASGLPVAGSFAFGLAWVCIGTAFAATAAVTAQVARGARAATGLALAALGVAYLVRAVGDAVGPAWLSWLSPFHWGHQVRPFAGDRWWVAVVALGCAAALTVAAFRLAARRDLGAGVLAERHGPAHARFHGPLGLAWRLQRGALAAWAVGFTLYGLLVGSVASSLGDMLDTPAAREVFTRLGGEKGLSDAVLTAMFGFLGVLAAAYGIQAAKHLDTEETSGRLHALLAVPLGRTRWAAGHLAIAFGGTAALLLCAGTATGAIRAAQTGDRSVFGDVLTGALVQVPAAWVLTGLVVLVHGLAPRATAVTWALFAALLLLGELGPLLDLDHRLLDLSPFTHVPEPPVTATPLLWLTTVAALLTAAGLAALRGRDIR
ncbi:ABC transporter permease [Saccharothrix sp. NPDC042600]|uniref:ABC transporter permease n=1 Tax=Saccharothrix TaxID=2071 RepID=UPI00340E3780|nr:multidrug efflux ABC transporter permease [Saccharothrix mutabilis subsp. capreolus]